MHYLIYPFCSIFIIIGACLSFVTLKGVIRATGLKSWPTAEATISECDFEVHHDSEGADSYEVKVTYHYKVNGFEYESNSIHPAYSATSFSGHRKFYDRLKKAQVVKIRYNNLDPNESYLITGNYSSHLAAFFGGMIFLSAGIFFLLTFHFAFNGNSDYVSGLDILKWPNLQFLPFVTSRKLDCLKAINHLCLPKLKWNNE